MSRSTRSRTSSRARRARASRSSMVRGWRSRPCARASSVTGRSWVSPPAAPTSLAARSSCWWTTGRGGSGSGARRSAVSRSGTRRLRASCGGRSRRGASSPGTIGRSAKRDASPRRAGRPGVPPGLVRRACRVALGGGPTVRHATLVHALRGVLWVTTGLDTGLGRNVARQPEVTLLLWGEARRRPGGALRLRARATRHAGLPPWAVLLRIAARYYLAPGALASELGNVTRWLLRARYYAQVGGGAGHVRLVPLDAEVVTAP